MKPAQRILIAGGPNVGKTTLANHLGAELGIVPRHTDDLIGRLDWSAASAEVARWMAQDGPWIIEGVAVARAMRKWLAANESGLPCDRLLLGHTARVPLLAGQAAMAKGCATVWAEIRGELARRGLHAEGF